MKTVDPLFDGFFCDGAHLKGENCRLATFALGYGRQAADVTDRNSNEPGFDRSRSAWDDKTETAFGRRAYLLSSSIRRIGISARLRTGSDKVISGSMFNSASYAFSNVFIFMNRHSPQKQLSVGPGINLLLGISLRSRCNNPASVTTMISRAGDSLQNVTIFSVEQTSSASMRTAYVHSGCATTGAWGYSSRILLILRAVNSMCT